ncbi:unnamed protein product, partial [marine sediment metagenome]
MDYEELPAIFSPLEGIKPDAPIIHEDLGSYKHASIILPQGGTNISNHYKIRKGDAEKGFKEADFVFENDFYVP